MTTTQQIPIEELKALVAGYDYDVHAGAWFLRLKSGQRLFINSGVLRRFGDVDEILKLPSHYSAYVREWRGAAWVYRVSTDDYVEVPSQAIVRVVDEARQALGGAFTDFGVWRDLKVEEWEGATYGEATLRVGSERPTRLGQAYFLVRVLWGNDGNTAIRVYSALGILACVNGLVIGTHFGAVMYHSHARAWLEPTEAVLARLRQAIVKAGTTVAQDAEGVIERLGRTPIDRVEVQRLARRLGREFARLWQTYVQRHGENALALAQALSWVATHGGQSRREIAIREMARLVQAQAPGPN